MLNLADCFDADINIPKDPEKSKSKKLMKIAGMWFFIQHTKTFIKIYEVSTKKLIMAPGDLNKGLDKLVDNIDEVKKAVEEYKNGR